MSILIKGLKMPNEDELLCIKIYPSGKVTFDMDLQCKQIAEAFGLPDHGDLIDRDEMLCDFAELRDYDFASREYVVIPAERSEE